VYGINVLLLAPAHIVYGNDVVLLASAHIVFLREPYQLSNMQAKIMLPTTEGN